ncbi:MAG TPA: hypothetical protein VIH90_04340 [Candidatus Saccharimonadales bacterium]
MSSPQGKNKNRSGSPKSERERTNASPTTEGRLGRFATWYVESPIVTNTITVLAVIGIGGSLGVVVKEEMNKAKPNTSAPTTITSISNSSLTDFNHLQNPTIDPVTHGASSMADCGIVPNTGKGKPYINTNDYASSYNPVFTPLIRIGNDNIQNYATVHEIDWYGLNTSVGWSDGLDISISKTDRVTLTGALGGVSPPSNYDGKNSPNGSFTLTPGNVASGAFGLMDYTIENNNGNFYLGLVCDPWKTQQILAHPNG